MDPEAKKNLALPEPVVVLHEDLHPDFLNIERGLDSG
jgi:hypothetical protein